MRRYLLCGLAVAVAANSSRQAFAHLVSTELGPFYDGAAHPLVAPEDLLTILGLALLAAYGGPQAGRRLLLALSSGWSVGLFAAFGLARHEWEAPIATAGVILLLGLTTLLKAQPPAALLAAAGGLIGLLRGGLNGSVAQAENGEWMTVIGIAASVFLLAALLTGLSAFLEKRGALIVLRVGGSWTAAVGLLMLGWQLRRLLSPQ